MKVALVHDFLNQYGGAERVLKALTEIYPEAPVYTLFYDEELARKYFPQTRFIASFLQKKKFLRKHHKYLLPFLPVAIESFDFSEYEVVISDSSAWAKGILTKPQTPHISYCHSPTRFLWDWHIQYLKEQKLGKIKKSLVLPLLNYLRLWDLVSAKRVDYWIANSQNTQARIKKFYHQDSVVIYPPLDVSKFKISSSHDDFFLVVSRLSPYKRIDLVIEAFNNLGLPLIVIGEGQDKARLEKMARSNIKFLGFQEDEVVARYYSRCRALIFPTFDEDFGLVPLEAMASGRPVIAAGRGGTRETIVEGKTGLFFNQPTIDSLIKAIRKFFDLEDQFNPEEIRRHAGQFESKIFKEKLAAFVQKAYLDYQKKIVA